MSLLKKATNQTCYLKAGILGFAGSGKTYTAAELAIGLCKLTGKTKAAFFDSETGSDFMIKKFENAGIELFVYKGRAFKDLIAVIKEAEAQELGALVVDSISHVWRELMDSYITRLKRKNGLYFQDWGTIKAEWQQFPDLFVNSKLNVIMCGRAGYEYDMEKNEDTGKNELIKTGTKMKVEGEMGFEPSLLLEMERISKPDVKGWVNRCTILKDRTDTMNGAIIDYPKFKDFNKIIKFLNIGGEHIGVDTTRNSEDMFESADWSYAEAKKQRDILLEQLQEVLVLSGLDGRSAEAQKKRTEALIDVFGTSSKTAIENLRFDDLRVGIETIKTKLLGPKQENGNPVGIDKKEAISF